MISVSQLNLTLNNKPVLDGFDLTVREGEVFGIAGLKGAGRTSFLKVLATILKPSSGDVRISGFDVVKDRGTVRAMIGYMPGTAVSDNGLTVNEHLRFFLSMYGISNAGFLHSLDSLLDELGLAQFKDVLLYELSAEEKQKVSLARAVMHDPSVLLLDEPENGMSDKGLESLASSIETQRGRKKAVIAASDSISFLNKIAHRIGLLHEGRLMQIFHPGVDSCGSIEKRMNDLRKVKNESCTA
ncbi:MAG: ABC transporter ATP-binding protein [Nitrospirae bacterium]|nr:ABC transporter ATP-binding protein [Nitrospirota bacterium]